MGECVSVLEDAVAREDVAGWQLAFLQDRVRLGLNSIEERQEQITEQERKRRANIEQTSYPSAGLRPPPDAVVLPTKSRHCCVH